MSNIGVLIVGSGPAGVAAAESFRKAGGTSAVTIVTTDSSRPCFRPPLSKDFLRGDVSASEIELHTAQWFSDLGIELIRDDTVVSIDIHAQRATTHGGRSIFYAQLILASGADPKPLAVPGGHKALPLRSLHDAEVLRDAASGADTAVVVGAGFIGCEAAASLAHRGIATTLVTPDQVPQQKRLGFSAGERITDFLSEAGVQYVGGVKVSAVHGDSVRLDNGVSITTDVVLAATGVAPRTELVARTGISMAAERIAVDEHMRTSIANVYAAGDVALAINRIAGRRVLVEHWQDAITQGTIAGANAAGESSSWCEVPGFWTTIGDRTLKYAAWGDGYGRARLVEKEAGFSVWYETNGITVGILTLDADDDYAEGQNRIRSGAALPW
ncbi:NAD(P)/FAD-dependent oxidoreductase [Rhodococcus globerulus]|uniref:NAD(P)/FAD-dependent oxidoreductase n=1 Tax=Rhodococcus globerulus TaxID=33008 RepID=UPI00158682EC|nr:FAD/NAD(P)-binding oxidoreductase [Rhodococcus globerulus]